MSHTKLRPFIVKVSVLGYFPLHIHEYIYIYIYIIKYMIFRYIEYTLISDTCIYTHIYMGTLWRNHNSYLLYFILI